MNIVFMTQTYATGGVAMVTVKLANEFARRGHQVSIVTFYESRQGSVEYLVDSRVNRYRLNGLKVSADNVVELHRIFTDRQVQIAINQWGLNPVILRTALKAAKGMDVKFVSVYHNAPNMNGRLQQIDDKIDASRNGWVKTLHRMQRWVYQEITSYSMRWNYHHSHLFLVLSPAFIQAFCSFTHIRRVDKLAALANPVTIEKGGFCYDVKQKRKEIIFVGRIEMNPKRIDRILQVWSLLYEAHPDWCLTVVGDGPDRSKIEQLTKQMQLPRVSFEGFQSPLEYYKRASFLMLTSDFEGFPLVLAEAMSFGVLPVVYASFASVYDIVEDGTDGLIMPKTSEPFRPERMAEAMSRIMDDETLRNRMAYAAMKKSGLYSMDVICRQWEKLFNDLLTE